MNHDRPVEDYVLARIAVEERLHRLKAGYYRMAVFHLSGFTVDELTQIFNVSRTTVTANTRRLFPDED